MRTGRRRWTQALPLALLGGLILLLFLGLSLDPREVDSPLIGQPAPDFSLPTLQGEATLSTADLASGVTLFNVWGSYCVPCLAEHPILVELARRRDIRIFGLNYKDVPQEAVRWLTRHGNPYVASGIDRDGAVGLDWGVYGVPETFVIDRQGIVRAKRVGPITWPWVNDELLPLINRLQNS